MKGIKRSLIGCALTLSLAGLSVAVTGSETSQADIIQNSDTVLVSETDVRLEGLSQETREWLAAEELDQRVAEAAEDNPELIGQVESLRERLIIKNSEKFVNILLAVAVARSSTQASK